MIDMMPPVLASILATADATGVPIFVLCAYGYTALVCKFIWHDVPANQRG